MSRRAKRILIGCVGVLVIAVGALWGVFGSSEICTSCGAMRYTTRWQVPFTDITYWTHRSEETTPLSRVVARHGLRSTSDHRWLFSSGAGNGTMCAIGEGRHLLTAVLSTEVATFVDSVARYQGKDAAARWLDALIDPKRSFNVSGLIRGSNVPPGFADAVAFENWWRSEREMLNLALDESP